ncbi:MAG TPA: hypothetical protein VGL15_04010 [Vicinamibacteria bacterium]|jgi:hypothetical protein
MGRPGVLVSLAAVALGTGCLVQIDHVADPGPAFRRARAEALRIAGTGRPHEVSVLAYDAGERELVRVTVPLWLVKKAQRHVDWEEDALAGRHGRARVAERLRHLNWKDLEAAGRGILVEAEEDGGEQVLIWLR